MTRLKLLERLYGINREHEDDPEVCHIKKDEALLEYINDADIEAEFQKGYMWYA